MKQSTKELVAQLTLGLICTLVFLGLIFGAIALAEWACTWPFSHAVLFICCPVAVLLWAVLKFDR